MSPGPVEVWHELMSAYGALAQQFGDELQRTHQVSLPEFEALLWLHRADGEPVQATDLIGKLLLTQSGITRLLGRLETAGLITRSPCTADRRRKDITLTARGQDAIELMRDKHRSHIESLIGAKLRPSQMADLVDLLGTLTH